MVRVETLGLSGCIGRQASMATFGMPCKLRELMYSLLWEMVEVIEMTAVHEAVPRAFAIGPCLRPLILGNRLGYCRPITGTRTQCGANVSQGY
jgi:hypothetical protein